MSNSVHEIYAYLCVPDVDAAIAFYTKAFGAREHFRLTEPDGRVGHAEIYLGNGAVMLSEEYPEIGVTAPAEGGCTSVSIHLHIDDVAAMLQTAMDAGAQVLRPAEDQFHGERMATIRDPFGFRWMLGHTIEDVATDEMQRRYQALFETPA